MPRGSTGAPTGRSSPSRLRSGGGSRSSAAGPAPARRRRSRRCSRACSQPNRTCASRSRPDRQGGGADARRVARARAHLPEDLRARLPQTSHTLHRLLGVTPQPGRFRHHAGNPLPLDVLVVDEASMLDLALATRSSTRFRPTRG